MEIGESWGSGRRFCWVFLCCNFPSPAPLSAVVPNFRCPLCSLCPLAHAPRPILGKPPRRHHDPYSPALRSPQPVRCLVLLALHNATFSFLRKSHAPHTSKSPVRHDCPDQLLNPRGGRFSSSVTNAWQSFPSSFPCINDRMPSNCRVAPSFIKSSFSPQTPKSEIAL